MHLFFTVIEVTYALAATAACFAFFHGRGNTLAEAGAYALAAMLMLHSWTAQLALMAGWQRYHVVSLAVLSLPAMMIVAGNRRRWVSTLRAGCGFLRSHVLPAAALAGGGLALLAVRIRALASHSPAAAGASVHPALSLPDGSLLHQAGKAAFPALPNLNHAIFWASWQPDAAGAVAGLSAWLTIVLCIYALARRYAWPATALTVALLTAAMPRLVQQSLAVNSDLLPAAAVLVAILALYRAVEQPHAHDLAMLPTAIAYAAAGGRLTYLMPAILCPLSVILLRRRHHARFWPRAIVAHPPAAALAAAAAAVFSQAAVVAGNLVCGKEWIGETAVDKVAFNRDGLSGAAANLGRYLLQAIHMPECFDHAFHWLFGASARAALAGIHRWPIEALFGRQGAAAAFTLTWGPHDPWGWFGPAGYFLILPALVFVLWRGPRRLKSTAVAMLAYLLSICLILAWRPENVRMLTVFFAGSGFLAAFLLPPWRFGRRGLLVLQIMSIIIGGYTL